MREMLARHRGNLALVAAKIIVATSRLARAALTNNQRSVIVSIHRWNGRWFSPEDLRVGRQEPAAGSGMAADVQSQIY